MLYLDTSLIIAAMTKEKSSPYVQAWLEKNSSDQSMLISDWNVTEVSSALAIKLRTGEITLDQRAAALALFNKYISERFVLLPVKSVHFRIAARFVDRHTLGVRGNDALHLAVASEYGAMVCTLDRQLAEAGPALGVPTRLVN